MEQRYRLSAGALLYAVCKLHKSGIYGVPQVMPRLSDRGFPAFAQEAELELLAAGCGMLSFDGEFTVEPDFAALLGSCADCRSVVGASLRRNGVWKKLTLYPAARAILEREEDNTCVLRTAAQPMNALLEVLELPEDPEEPPLEVRGHRSAGKAEPGKGDGGGLRRGPGADDPVRSGRHRRVPSSEPCGKPGTHRGAAAGLRQRGHFVRRRGVQRDAGAFALLAPRPGGSDSAAAGMDEGGTEQ